MDDQTVYVVDDEPVAREMIRQMLEVSGYRVEGYDSAEAFLAAWAGGRPGCLILDMVMPGMSGEALQEELTRRHIDLPVIFLSGHGDIPTTVRAMRGGALDFLTKPVPLPVLLKAVESALASDRRARQMDNDRRAFKTRLDKLSQRERQVLDLALTGMQNKEIARMLDLSHRTVEVHRSRIFLKLGVTSVVEAIRRVAELDLPMQVRPSFTSSDAFARDRDEETSENAD
jgi:RNA polymerase sigma factor (sigma-70 family)